MNPSIKKLAAIAAQERRTIIGLMSGTSLDGLDIALCNISGSGKHTRVNLTHFVTKSYSEYHKSHLKKISSVEKVSLAELCWQHTWLAAYHAELILEALSGWGISPEDVDCIGSHGQTIYHLPARDQKGFPRSLNSTLQIADGDQIASRTGILTISDFRQKHTAHGGEGAPMAALVDRILFGDETESRILLNIGGIGNYTWLPADSQSDLSSFTTDTGPGNTLIDNLAYIYFQKPFDEDGMIASSGNINRKLLRALLEDPWFGKEETKSTGPEYFNYEWVSKRAEKAGSNLKKIRADDQLATVTELSAHTIAENIREHVPGYEECTIYISGGGAHNQHLVSRIKEHLGRTVVRDFSELGYDPDAKEAMIFAVLANEMLAGEGFDFENDEGSVHKLNFGKISFPV
jgi:anhydro-N-acetylmuramic acid kinase